MRSSGWTCSSPSRIAHQSLRGLFLPYFLLETRFIWSATFAPYCFLLFIYYWIYSASNQHWLCAFLLKCVLGVKEKKPVHSVIHTSSEPFISHFLHWRHTCIILHLHFVTAALRYFFHKFFLRILLMLGTQGTCVVIWFFFLSLFLFFVPKQLPQTCSEAFPLQINFLICRHVWRCSTALINVNLHLNTLDSLFPRQFETVFNFSEQVWRPPVCSPSQLSHSLSCWSSVSGTAAQPADLFSSTRLSPVTPALLASFCFTWERL